MAGGEGGEEEIAAGENLYRVANGSERSSSEITSESYLAAVFMEV